MAHALQYKKKFCLGLYEHMAKGQSYSTYTLDVGVSRDTFYEWEEKYPEWKEAKQRGYQAGLKFFETLLITRASGQKIKGSNGVDLSATIFVLKTRFHKDYGEKMELDHKSSDNSVTVSFVKTEKTK